MFGFFSRKSRMHRVNRGVPALARVSHSRQVSSIEIDGSFYSLQLPKSYSAWNDASPEGFVFSIKGSCFITQMKRLKNVETPLANFFASGVLRLEENSARFCGSYRPAFVSVQSDYGSSLTCCPVTPGRRLIWRRSTMSGCAVGRGRRLTARALRHAIEVRHSSFETQEFIALLREHDIAMVVADTAGKWPLIEDPTSDFVYVRLHGDEELYVSGYTPEALGIWGRKVRAWAKGKTPAEARLLDKRPPAKERAVFVYFDNDAKVHAPFDAMSLAQQLRLGVAPAGAAEFSQIMDGAGWNGRRSPGGGGSNWNFRLRPCAELSFVRWLVA
jgi:uncharacterized protein YecE (DUF72 family)